ncbi:hypothetical protein IFM89_028237 [Coptis chinensis]|uniref:Kinesin motor domain-containing protein n=1 Tax=Coptis chinensis TaxID=261450 RepID=A0A835IQQ2_9MAGN|nr:hypothetical protein IFM89_028237 [Coptis chinensis]
MILTQEEQISLPSEKVEDAMESPSSALNTDLFDGIPLVSELPESPPTTAEELKGLRVKHRSLDEKRREALNKVLDLKGSIRVFCRVRPFLSTDKKRLRDPISIGSEKVVVRSNSVKKEFSLDKVFPQEAGQEDVFLEVEPIIRSALDGNNVCILAYGQTGTGKTFTMEGTNKQPGIVPQVLEKLFSLAARDNSISYSFSMSMLEVYMGSLRDLLAPKLPARTHETSSKCNLNIQSDPNGFIKVEGLTDVSVSDLTQASRWYTKGRRARSTSWTNVNDASSRSHCLARITIARSGTVEGVKAKVSKLWMVDLGGSERLLKTGATGQTLDEGRAINLSLSALGDVIAALKRNRGHVPYRQVLSWVLSLKLIVYIPFFGLNSKLTQILKDSLGDGSKVLMLVHTSPCEEDVGETTCSLIFAKRVRAVESNKEIPEVNDASEKVYLFGPNQPAMLQDLKRHREKTIVELNQKMRDAEEDCQKVKNQILKAEFLLHENKRLYSNTYLPPEDKESPRIPTEDYKEAMETPRIAEIAIRRNSSSSLPRFMTSTVASRHRQGVADGETNLRTRSLKLTQSSLQFSGSQSLSYSDPHFRTVLRSSSKMSRHAEPKTSVTDITNCKDLDSRILSTPRQKKVTASHPNLRVATLCHHRRRMSDLV